MHNSPWMAGTNLARTIFDGPKPVRAIEVLLFDVDKSTPMNNHNIFGANEQNMVNVLKFRTPVACQKGKDKQRRPRSDCF